MRCIREGRRLDTERGTWTQVERGIHTLFTSVSMSGGLRPTCRCDWKYRYCRQCFRCGLREGFTLSRILVDHDRPGLADGVSALAPAHSGARFIATMSGHSVAVGGMVRSSCNLSSLAAVVRPRCITHQSAAQVAVDAERLYSHHGEQGRDEHGFLKHFRVKATAARMRSWGSADSACYVYSMSA